MYIYSQSKDRIERLYDCSINDYKGYTILVNGNIAGTYSTESRCREVTADIARAIAYGKSIYVMPADEGSK